MKINFLKKSLVFAIIYLFIFTIIYTASATDNYEDLLNHKQINCNISPDNLTGILTHGPFMPLLNIAEINIVSGHTDQIEKIQSILRNRILQVILFEQTVEVSDLDFSVTYNIDIPRPKSVIGDYIFIRFGYVTSIGYGKNSSSIGYTRHAVIIKGFNGEFSIGRPPLPFRLFPPRFSFCGDCKEVKIIN